MKNDTMKTTTINKLSIDPNHLLIGLSNSSRIERNNFSLSKISLLISQPQNTYTVDSEIQIPTSLDAENRFSFFSANPTQTQLFSNQKQIDDWKASLPNISNSITVPEETNTQHIPFHSGWMGYFSYPSKNAPTIAEFNYYPWTICLDLNSNTFHLLGQPDEAAKLAFSWLLQCQSKSSPINSDNVHYSQVQRKQTTPFRAESFRPVWNTDEYQKAFSRVKAYLLAGDSYQVNLTQPFVSEQFTGSPAGTLLPLINALKPNFGCYFQGQNCELVSLSPERFISIDNHGKLEAKPIKGTIKRSDDSSTDKELIAELINSEKNKAENLMIVDLLRNDLSISALPGSVRVDKLFELESQPNVHHLVSTISAQLKPGVSPVNAICSAFPGGSITGAPKKRAMEIIEELEVQPRSLYCGSFGYFSDTGHTDFNILIRSLEFRDGKITCWGGGGITIESECTDEYEESITKIRRIMDVVESIGKNN